MAGMPGRSGGPRPNSGGRRLGAGRPRKITRLAEAQWLDEVYRQLGGKVEGSAAPRVKAWSILTDALVSEDGKLKAKAWSIYADILKYLADREYGRPKQQTGLAFGDDGPVALILDI